MLRRLLIAHMGTTENVTKSRCSLIHQWTPTQTVKEISILTPENCVWRRNRVDGKRKSSRVPEVCKSHGAPDCQSRKTGQPCFCKHFHTCDSPHSSLPSQTMKPGRSRSSDMHGWRKRRAGRGWHPFKFHRAVPTKGTPLWSRRGAAARLAGFNGVKSTTLWKSEVRANE